MRLKHGRKLITCIHSLIVALMLLQSVVPVAQARVHEGSTSDVNERSTDQEELLTDPLVAASTNAASLFEEELHDGAILEEDDPPTEMEAVAAAAAPVSELLAEEAVALEAVRGPPVEMTVSLDKAYLLAGEVAKVAVQLWPSSDENVAGLPVEVTLPTGLIVADAGQPLRWTLPELASDEHFSQVVRVQLEQSLTAASVGNVTVTITPKDGSASSSKRVQIGMLPGLTNLAGDEMVSAASAQSVQSDQGTILTAEGGDLVLMVPSAAMPQGTEVRFTRLDRAETSEEASATAANQNLDADQSEDSALPTFNPTGAVFLPLMAGSSSAAPSAPSSPSTDATPRSESEADGPSIWSHFSEGEEPVFHHWDFTAQSGETIISQFEQPLLLVYNTKWLSDGGVEPEQLGLFSRETAEDEWMSVPSTYVADQGVLVAKLSHFSEYKLGLELNVKGDIMPSISSFSSDLFTGSAMVRYPIEVPAGPGGMAPSLSLSYSSSGVNDFYDANRASSSDWDTQASPVGVGWNLGGIGYIALADRHSIANLWDDKYSLVLNGSSAEMHHASPYGPSALTMVPEQFTKIEKSLQYKNNSASSLGKVIDTGTWTVTGQDGTKHSFGSTADPRYGPSNSTQGMIVDFGRGRWQVNRWYLTESQDTSGNYISYSYKSDKRHVRPQGGNGCSTDSFFNNAWYYRDIQPDVISWGGNKNTGHGHTMQLLFGYSSRSDIRSDGGGSGPVASDKDWAYARCIQYMYGTKRLTSITVQVKVSGGWKNIRQYTLGQSYTTRPSGAPSYVKHLRLNNIKHYGYSSGNSRTGSPLNTYTFGYQQLSHHAQFYLTSADNGWGGKTTYWYANHNTTEYEISDNNVNQLNQTDTETYRRRVYQTKVDDGLGNYFYTVYGYGNARQRNYRGGVDFLGHDYVSSRTYKMNTGVSASNEVRYTQHYFHQLGGSNGANPDPRVGREYASQVYQPASTLAGGCGKRPKVTSNVLYCRMSRTDTTWTALQGSGTSWTGTTDYHARGRWVRQDKVINRIEHQHASSGYVTNEQRFYYETSRQNYKQYGQVTRTDEYADGVRQRIHYTQYYPNVSKHIVNKPSRMRVYAGNNSTCFSETRNIYDSTGNHYKVAPTKGLVARTETAVTSGCTSSYPIGTYSSSWAITHYGYDAYGNQTSVNQVGPSRSGSQNQVSVTTYDSTYRVFPIQVKNNRATGFKETAQYYGVNRSTSSAGGQWGAIAEHCAVNEVCTRLKYDAFGRPTFRWERVPKSNGWASDSQANVKYAYYTKGVSGLKTNAIIEWRSPRCYGNFIRRHYNGLGQLVHEQSPQQNWKTNVDGCNPGNYYAEIDVDYSYDSLGNQIYVSVPRKTTTGWTSASRRIAYSNWGGSTKTTSTYDVLGRPMQVTAPNGERTYHYYAGRASSVAQGDGYGSEPDKFIRWTENDGLGHLKYVRNYRKSGSNWVQDAQVTLTHDAVGNLKTVRTADGKTASMSYNKVGQKTYMNDPDLGTWTYAYDRLGNLTRQTDARNKTTCLYYQSTTNRLAGKRFLTHTNCNNQSGNYDIRYLYDTSGRGPSLGMLTQVYYHKSGGYYKNFWYNGNGQISQEQVRVPGTSAYTTKYYYDGAQRRYATKYPDGTYTRVEFNSMGLEKRLCDGYLSGSTVYCTGESIANSASYDEAGRLRYVKLFKGTDLHLRHDYGNWTSNNGRLSQIRVGTSSSSGSSSSYNRFRLNYSHDRFGNVAQISDRYNLGTTYSRSYSYDHVNRLTSEYGTSHSWKPSGRFNKFENRTVSYSSGSHVHAPTSVSGIGSYSYDANGNMTSRAGQSLSWNHENRLSQVKQGSTVLENYLYDDSGQRIKKWNGSSTVYYIGNHYEIEVGNGSVIASSVDLAQNEADELDQEQEVFDRPRCEVTSDDIDIAHLDGFYPDEDPESIVQEAEAELLEVTPPSESAQPSETELSIALFLPLVSGNTTSADSNTPEGTDLNHELAEGFEGVEGAAINATTIIKYYYFNGQRIAMRKGGTFYYLYGDHLGSTVLSTKTNGTVHTGQSYYGFGRKLGGASLPTDHRFTGQKLDTTGLMYYNARYYDPKIGHFISPDTLVPDAGLVFDYNRYMYVRGNPVNLNDPTGHQSCGGQYPISGCMPGFFATSTSPPAKSTPPGPLKRFWNWVTGADAQGAGQAGPEPEPAPPSQPSHLNPFEIRFSQNSYSPSGNILNPQGNETGERYSVAENIKTLENDPTFDFPAIYVFRKEDYMNEWGPLTVVHNGKVRSGDPINLDNGEIYTLDHRRLVAYREAGRTSIPVLWARDGKIRSERSKFSTPNGGTKIREDPENRPR
ncbi:MAG: RHS repeat-associated core domain-containing protein [Chloroflexota bacterium]